jgi:hypothetical protein
MASTTNRYVPRYDFREAEALSVEARFAESVSTARRLLAKSRYQTICTFPCIPGGASESELQHLQSKLSVPLPEEYRLFLAQHRYLKLDDGCEIGGLDHDGLGVTEGIWLSSEHRANVSYLVFAAYWRYADGDQLMFDLSEENQPVVAYLHEHGPAFELYAPSFSLAVWRLVHERF